MESIYDVIIIGGGPAGLSAAIYLARAKYSVLIIEKSHLGGQIAISHEVANYPGVGITSGSKLIDTMHKQVKYFGANTVFENVVKINDGNIKEIHTENNVYKALGIILAMGASPNKVGFLGEDEYKGRGVLYCATCDGAFYTDKEVFVIGGGYAACEESLYLTRYSKKITIIIRKNEFSIKDRIVDEVINHPKINILKNTKVLEVKGDDALNYIKYENIETKEVKEYRLENDFFGVFIYAGYIPESSLVSNLVTCDSNGYIITDETKKTNLDGIYAVGDITPKPLKQVISAAYDGVISTIGISKYVDILKKELNIKTLEVNMNKEIFNENNDEIFTSDIVSSLKTLFDKMNENIVLKLFLNNDSKSKELEYYVDNLCKLTSKIKKEKENSQISPKVEIYNPNSQKDAVTFYGIPGGHEFSSFMLGVYYMSKPKLDIKEDLYNRIKNIDRKLDIKVNVSLSCINCPSVVSNLYLISSINQNIKTQVIDINIFKEDLEKYNIKSVPAMIINEKVFFGKKNISELIDIIEKI